MIKVEILPNKIILKGHAMYATSGKDIVCAAASSIVITTINAALKIDNKSLSYEQTDDELVINILKDDDITNKLINNMKDLLYELKENYPKNISIK